MRHPTLSHTFICLGTVSLLAFAACGDRDDGRGPTPESERGPLQGLSVQEQDAFFHLAEGSEVIPLSWFRALEKADSDELFDTDLERFGLIHNPASPDGLPIGLSAEKPFDIGFAGRMLGVNCAACHVGQITSEGTTATILGGQNLFDLEGFYIALGKAGTATLKDHSKLRRFLTRLVQNRGAGPALTTGAAEPARTVSPYDEIEDELLQRLLELADEEEAQPEMFLPSDELRPPPIAGARAVPLDDVFKANDLSEIDRRMPENSRANLERLLSESGETAESRRSIASDIYYKIRVLKARVASLNGNRLQRPGETVPGAGRVDAFGSSRNQFFPDSDQLKKSAVSYPFLWGFGDQDWLHYDGNTTSVMQRNLGQALGVGAVVDPTTHASTLLPHNIAKLEELGRKIQPPEWPFGETDDSLVERGTAVWGEICQSCHPAEPNNDLFQLDEVGTDPVRATSFATPLSDGSVFSDRLAELLTKVQAVSYRLNNVTEQDAAKYDYGVTPVWRSTRAYVARPLTGVWATAPYLHNGSVPTLADLLKPTAERPETFVLGTREYDLDALGYKNEGGAQSFTFDTTKDGNSNAGHSGTDYGTDLSESDKKALLEFLKTH